MLTYILITPARNEADLIRVTLESMVRQVAKPLRWVIVSDGSTDGTDEIVREYAAHYPWIELLRDARPFRAPLRGQSASVRGRLRQRQRPLLRRHRLVGRRHLLRRRSISHSCSPGWRRTLASDLSGRRSRTSRTYDYRFVSIEHVSGACQLFRRECFEDIGGYVPMKLGGIDHVAVITARMRGWKTRTFPEKHCLHHRKMGSALHGRIRAVYRIGVLDYALGGHPLWEVFRAAYQATQRPRIVRGVVLYAGYLSAAARRLERPVSRNSSPSGGGNRCGASAPSPSIGSRPLAVTRLSVRPRVLKKIARSTGLRRGLEGRCSDHHQRGRLRPLPGRDRRHPRVLRTRASHLSERDGVHEGLRSRRDTRAQGRPRRGSSLEPERAPHRSRCAAPVARRPRTGRQVPGGAQVRAPSLQPLSEEAVRLGVPSARSTSSPGFTPERPRT